MKLAIGERYHKLFRISLDRIGVEPLWIPDNPDLDPRLAGHADLNLYFDGSTLWAAQGVAGYIANNLTIIPTRIVTNISKNYPSDARLCVCPVGEYLLCNPKTAENSILEQTKKEILPVRQGYTRCTVCVVSDRAILTADTAIASAGVKNGMDVLLMEPGHIRLDGYDYGFIGGASIHMDAHHLAFTGHLHGHPDETAIMNFLKNHDVKPIFFTDLPIFDIGGGVWLP